VNAASNVPHNIVEELEISLLALNTEYQIKAQ
jgi:hypothetical protein